VARLRISLNEGSLLRRTVLHVGAFVLGTAAFLALASFLLVTIMKSVLPSEQSDSAASSDSEEEAPANAVLSPSAKPGATKPPRPPRKKRSAASAAPQPTAEEE
jgi:hypothetical protein